MIEYGRSMTGWDLEGWMVDPCGDRGMKRVIDTKRKETTEVQGLMNGWRYWSMFDRRSG